MPAPRWLKGVAGAGVGVLGLTGALTWAGVKVLTDAPTPRRHRARLWARFHVGGTTPTAGDGRDVVHLTGDNAALPGRWGLAVDDGYVQIGDVLGEAVEATTGDTAVVRPYELLDGEVPDRQHQHDRRGGDRRWRRRRDSGGGDDPEVAGEERRSEDRRRSRDPGPWPVRARLAPYAWPDDPQILAERHGAVWSIDAIPAPGGALPAWRFVPEQSEASGTWLVGVHGRGARRSELFRLVHTALDAGVPSIVTSYRTDRWTANRSRVTTLGTTEWEDVQEAVRIALSAGARRVVLAGCSMGGAITASFLRQSLLARFVVGVILDSPALNWPPIIEHVARTRRVPGPLLPAIMAAARWRARIDWHALDHIAAADTFRHPILLIHGTEDTVVPVWLSDAFAAARPDLVTYLRVEGAGHVHAWNHATEAYEAAVTRALAEAADAPMAAAPVWVRPSGEDAQQVRLPG